MAESRRLPDRRNHLLEDNPPPYSELVARRRLGQTQLTARMVAPPGVEVDPATLGAFDYAHLRAPLPRGIVSGMFKSAPSPSSYFLMRRSSDGYVSATGMFKARFPWAEVEEEEAERKYLKSLPTTSGQETAGNVWIPPEEALVLAHEYGVVHWIRALLDPTDVIPSGPMDALPPKEIRAPPKFFISKMDLYSTLIPQPATRSSARIRRSVSPSKPAVNRRSVASPRKRRQASQSSAVDTPPGSANGSFASTLVNGDGLGPSPSSTQATKVDVLDNFVKIQSIEKDLDSVEEESEVRVDAEEHVETDEEGEEASHASAESDEALFAEMPGPEDAARILQAARETVEASKKAATASEDDESDEDDESEKAEASAGKVASASKNAPASKKTKRKADDVTKGQDDTDSAETDDEAEHRAKKPKTEVEARKEGVKKRAIYGIAGTIAIGALAALTPYVLG